MLGILSVVTSVCDAVGCWLWLELFVRVTDLLPCCGEMETHPWKSGGGEYCGSGVGTGEAGDCHPTWSQGGPKGQAFQAKGTEGTTAWMCAFSFQPVMGVPPNPTDTPTPPHPTPGLLSMLDPVLDALHLILWRMEMSSL